MDGTEKLLITKDRITYNQDLYSKNLQVVMDRIETPIMKRFSEIVTQNGGHILEIGFGLGISADFIYNSNIKSYTCIEIHPEIYKNALIWSKNKKNVNIILGNWIDIIPKLNKKFDGIFMDIYGDIKFVYKFKKYCYKIANENCILITFNPMLQLISDPSFEFEKFKFKKQEYLEMTKNEIDIAYSYFINGRFKRKSKPNKLL